MGGGAGARLIARPNHKYTVSFVEVSNTFNGTYHGIKLGLSLIWGFRAESVVLHAGAHRFDLGVIEGLR